MLNKESEGGDSLSSCRMAGCHKELLGKGEMACCQCVNSDEGLSGHVESRILVNSSQSTGDAQNTTLQGIQK